ncbi:2-keto-3-deoxy-L-rhamnonate aldolase [Fusarium oxysporum f. sp. albedinis]|nr:2-keto-3-deoxy-L-rhamnonate aldolase [Fusarium oxysporum f. sp. albedinis]
MVCRSNVLITGAPVPGASPAVCTSPVILTFVPTSPRQNQLISLTTTPKYTTATTETAMGKLAILESTPGLGEIEPWVLDLRTKSGIVTQLEIY